MMLLSGRDDGDPLFLQAKQAQESVLEPYAGRSEFTNAGQRVVAGQRLMQASSDIFLGWHRISSPVDGVARDYYVRQLRDWKASADVDNMDPARLHLYGRMCAWTLAKAHARSGTGSRWLPTSAAGAPSTRRSRTSPLPTRSRTRRITRRCSRP